LTQSIKERGEKGMFKMAVDEKDVEQITEHLYRWKDPSRLVPDPYLFVLAEKEYQVDEDDYYLKGKYYAANYVANDILKVLFHLTDSEMGLVQMTRNLRDDFRKYPDKMDKLAREYNDRLNTKLKELKDQKTSTDEQQPAKVETQQKSLSIVSPEAVGRFFGVPAEIAPMLFTVFKDNESGIARPYINLVGMLYLDAKKGYQKIDTVVNQVGPDDWEAEARIYPKVTVQMLEAFNKLSHEYQDKLFDQIFGPTVETGRANKMNVRNTKMYPWLKEMAKARAVNRASRLYCGYGGTTYEELPEGEINPADVAKI